MSGSRINEISTRTTDSTVDSRARTKNVCGDDQNKEKRRREKSSAGSGGNLFSGDLKGACNSIDEDEIDNENDNNGNDNYSDDISLERKDKKGSDKANHENDHAKKSEINTSKFETEKEGKEKDKQKVRKKEIIKFQLDNDSDDYVEGVNENNFLSDPGFVDEFSSSFDEIDEKQLEFVSPFIFSPDFVPDCYLDLEVFEKASNLDINNMDKFAPVKNTENLQYSAEVAAEYEKLYDDMEHLMDYGDEEFEDEDEEDDDDDDDDDDDGNFSSGCGSDEEDVEDEGEGEGRGEKEIMMIKVELEEENEAIGRERGRGRDTAGVERERNDCYIQGGGRGSQMKGEKEVLWSEMENRRGSAGEINGIYDYSMTVDLAGNRQGQDLAVGQGQGVGVGVIDEKEKVRFRTESDDNVNELERSFEKRKSRNNDDNSNDNDYTKESERDINERTELRISTKESVCSVSNDVLERMDAPDLINWFQRTMESSCSEKTPDRQSKKLEIDQPIDSIRCEKDVEGITKLNVKTDNVSNKSEEDRGPSTDDSVLSVFSQDDIDSIHYNSLADAQQQQQQQSGKTQDPIESQNQNSKDLEPDINKNNRDLGPAIFTLPKRVCVIRTEDFSGIVKNFSQACNPEELSTVRQLELNSVDERNRELNKKILKVKKLRKSLESCLGISAFEESIMFLRSVAGADVEVEMTDDDDYLLCEMEEIVGADGLKYLDKLYALITLEAEIDLEYDHIDD